MHAFCMYVRWIIVLLYMRCLISINDVLADGNVLTWQNNDLPKAYTAILAVINNTKLKKKKQVEQISKALENNKTFDINTVDKTGRSLLHYAYNKGISSIVDYLLQLDNIDVNVVSNDGSSPLMECMNGYSQTHDVLSVNPTYHQSPLTNRFK